MKSFFLFSILQAPKGPKFKPSSRGPHEAKKIRPHYMEKRGPHEAKKMRPNYVEKRGAHEAKKNKAKLCGKKGNP